MWENVGMVGQWGVVVWNLEMWRARGIPHASFSLVTLPLPTFSLDMCNPSPDLSTPLCFSLQPSQCICRVHNDHSASSLQGPLPQVSPCPPQRRSSVAALLPMAVR